MKTNFIKISHFYYQENERSELSVQIGNSFILRTNSIKDLGVHIDCKLHFHRHVDFLSLHALKLIGLIRTVIFSFSTLDSLLMLYFALVRSKLEYASVAWNSVMITDSNKLERI
jgi:hypothetical protein